MRTENGEGTWWAPGPLRRRSCWPARVTAFQHATYLNHLSPADITRRVFHSRNFSSCRDPSLAKRGAFTCMASVALGELTTSHAAPFDKAQKKVSQLRGAAVLRQMAAS